MTGMAVIATPLVIATLLVIADHWLVIADSIRNPGSVWHWIPDQVRDDSFGVPDDSLGGRDDNLGGGQPPLFPFGGDMHG